MDFSLLYYDLNTIKLENVSYLSSTRGVWLYRKYDCKQ